MKHATAFSGKRILKDEDYGKEVDAALAAV